MQVQFILITEFGDFHSILMPIIGDEEFEEIKEKSQNYWETGFEMFLEDGGFIIFTPEVTKKSILKINRYE
jgi:hypothetical protein